MSNFLFQLILLVGDMLQFEFVPGVSFASLLFAGAFIELAWWFLRVPNKGGAIRVSRPKASDNKSSDS